ncbi:MAG: ABC transporter permease [Propionibacterium sp.]|nr:MAG: ABC transporter permease [Propionibacterium sp.]
MKLPILTVPGVPVVAISALLCLLAGAGFISGRLSGKWPAIAGTIAGLALIAGFLTWAAADRELPFQVANQFAGTIALATPLVFGALCGVLSERSGVVNVAIEGQFLAAAFAAAIVGGTTQSILAALIAAIFAATLMAAVLALFSLKYLVDQVVLGVVINLLVSGLTGFFYDELLQNTSPAPVLSKLRIPLLGDIPFFGTVLFNQNLLVYLGILSVIVVWFLLYRTKWGMRVRAVGEHPSAADTVGIRVIATRWSAVLVGGAFSGLGGAAFIIATNGGFTKDITVGKGFIALAAVIMGRWHPVLAATMALFFGFVLQLGDSLGPLRTPMPSDFLGMLPYIATIIAVAGLVGRVRPPAADGIPYVKGHH